ncbi:MAG: hypothetical protein ACE5GW_01715 [Planctomycetota bacterium]
MIEINHAFKKELPELLRQVGADMAQVLDMPVEFLAAELEVKPIEVYFKSRGSGAVCCRSVFTRKSCGIGGILVGEETTSVMSRAILAHDPPSQDEPFLFEGLVSEAMSELFNILTGSWNRVASPEYRLSMKTDDRSVEHYATDLPFPAEAGVYPEVVVVPITMGERRSSVGIFLPLKAIHGMDHADFQVPGDFVRDVAITRSSEGGGPSRAREGGRPAAGSGGEGKPILFLDYSGRLVRWLRQQAENGSVEYQLCTDRSSSELASAATLPAAILLVGPDAALLESLPNLSVVEIHTGD